MALQAIIYGKLPLSGFPRLALTFADSRITSHSAGTNDSFWQPHPSLDRTDADITLIFFAPNSVTYSAPVYDPLFTATTATDPSKSNETEFDGSKYTSDFWVSVIACADQYQLCNPNGMICTPLTGLYEAESRLIDELQLNERQKVIADSLLYALQTQSTYYSVSSRGAASLRASDTLSGTNMVQITLPNDQSR